MKNQHGIQLLFSDSKFSESTLPRPYRDTSADSMANPLQGPTRHDVNVNTDIVHLFIFSGAQEVSQLHSDDGTAVHKLMCQAELEFTETIEATIITTITRARSLHTKGWAGAQRGQ